MKMICICFCTYFYEDAKKMQKENENAKKRNKKESANFKNEDAYFQERRCKKKIRKRRRKF